MNLFEARYAGSSVYIDYVKKSIAEITERVDAIAKQRDQFKDSNEACAWALDTYEEARGYGCEEVFMFSKNYGLEESRQAVEDLEKEFGKASVSHDFHEEINTWGSESRGIPNDFTVQVFTTRDDGLDLDPFIIVFHDFGIDPSRIMSSNY